MSLTPQPFHTTRSADSDRPRLLLVSYNFPPRQSAGALRWRKLSSYLHEAGWDLDVLTTPPETSASQGEGLADLPPGVSLYHVPETAGRLRRFEDALAAPIRKRRAEAARSIQGADESAPVSAPTRPWVATESMTWFPRSPRDLVRLYKVLVDHEEFTTWTGTAVRMGQALARQTRYSAVLASGPPWSTTLAAARIATRHSLPLILDFRDPWGLPQPGFMEKTAHPLGPLLAARLEMEAVRTARIVITNTPTVERAMAIEYPWVPFTTIRNGVDDVFPDSGARKEDPFRIVYAGTIYLDRDPRVVFEPVGRMVRELGLSADDLRVEFVGNATHYHDVPVHELAEQAGIGAHFHLHEPMPRAQLLDFLKSGSVLVSLPQSTPWSTPSKIYEYMGFNAWLLVFAEKGSSTEEILRDSDAIVLDPTDREGTARALADCYRRHREGDIPSAEASVDRFARARTGEALLDLMASIDLVP